MKLLNDYFVGGVVLPLGDATGGHGLPVGATPGVVELPWLFPDPVFGFELFGLEGVPGKVPHGEPGADPGVVLGLIVEGCVVLPGVAGFVEFEPGTVEGTAGVAVPDCGVAVPDCGVAVPDCGVAVPADGVAVLEGGVAVLDGGVVVPGVCVGVVPAGGAVEGVLCATTQVAQHSINDKNVSFFADI